MRKRTWLFDKFREVARIFAFQEYDAPVLEYEELYTRCGVPPRHLLSVRRCLILLPPVVSLLTIRKAGEEITQQMYNFVDKGDQKVSLRPEMTPSLARLIIQKVASLARLSSRAGWRAHPDAVSSASGPGPDGARQVVQHSSVLEVRDRDQGQEERALPVEHGHHWRQGGGRSLHRLLWQAH